MATATYVAIQDVYAIELQDNTTHIVNDPERLFIGAWNPATHGLVRAFLEFGFTTPDTGSYTAGAKITAAKVQIRCIQKSGTLDGAESISWYLMDTLAWDEDELRWSEFATGEAWDTPGGDYDTGPAFEMGIPADSWLSTNRDAPANAAMLAVLQSRLNTGGVGNEQPVSLVGVRSGGGSPENMTAYASTRHTTVSLFPTIQITSEVATVEITTEPGTFEEGEEVALAATATIDTSGDENDAIEWESDLDGALGTGASLNLTTLSVGTHTITASAWAGSDTVEITITEGEGGGGEGTDPAPGLSLGMRLLLMEE